MEEKKKIINNNRVVLEHLKEKTDKMIDAIKKIEKNSNHNKK